LGTLEISELDSEDTDILVDEFLGVFIDVGLDFNTVLIVTFKLDNQLITMRGKEGPMVQNTWRDSCLQECRILSRSS